MTIGPILVERAWVLLLLIPAALLLAWPALRLLRGAAGNRERLRRLFRENAGSWGRTGLRALAVACLLAAVAGVCVLDAPAPLHTVFLVDISESMVDSAATRKTLESLYGTLPAEDPRAVVLFAGDASVEMDFADAPRGAGAPGLDLDHPQSKLDRSSSDFGGALNYACGLLPAEAGPRQVVLVSDGRDTSGEGLTAAAGAGAQGIRIQCAPVDLVGPADARIETMTVPDRARRGVAVPIDAGLRSDGPMRGRLLVHREDPAGSELLRGLPVEMKEAGWTTVRFIDRDPPPGAVVYRAKLIAEGDAFVGNNEAYAALFVTDAVRAAVIGKPDGPLWRRISEVREKLGIAAANLPPHDVPRDAKDLRWKYSVALVDGLPRSAMWEPQWAALSSFVRDHGGGLMAFGGAEAFGAGGHEEGCEFERALPILMEPEDDRVTHYLFLVDASLSMGERTGQGPKIEVAKEALAATVRQLRPQDLVSVIAFSGGAQTVVNAMPAARAEAIEVQLGNIRLVLNTDILNALQKAKEHIAAKAADRKVILLVSDGRPEGVPDQGRELPPAAEAIRESRGTLSTFLLGNDPQGAELMETLAKRGGGAFYKTGDISQLQKDLKAETDRTTKDKYTREGSFRPVVALPLPAIAAAGPWPELDWRNRVGKRPKAETAVTSGGDRSDPLLALGYMGRGRSVAICLPPGGGTGDRFFAPAGAWKGGGSLAASLIGWLQGGEEDPALSIRIETPRPGAQQVLANAVTGQGEPRNFLPLKAEVVETASSAPRAGGPVSAEVELRQAAPGEYSADLPRLGQGVYMVLVKERTEAGWVVRGRLLMSVPYSPEYLALGADRDYLRQLAEETGGKLANSPAEFRSSWAELKGPRGRQDGRPYFAAAAIAILLIELAARAWPAEDKRT